MRDAIYRAVKRVVPGAALAKAVIVYQRLGNYFKYDDYYFPTGIGIEISTYCNRKCSYCPVSIHGAPKKFMPLDVYDKIIDRLVEIDWAGIVDFAMFNEPLADTRLVELVRRAKVKLPRAMFRVISNGDYLTYDLAKALIDAGVTNFSITQHNLQRGEWNERVEKIASYWPSYFTLNVIHDRPLNNRGGILKLPQKNREQKMNCLVPSGDLQIRMDGQVALCCTDFYHEMEMGNVLKTPILEVWRGAEFSAIRRELRHGITRLPQCQACFYRTEKEG